MPLVISGPGAANSVSAASGGKVYGYNNITSVSNTSVAPANPNRYSLTFHNPGDVDIYVSPVQLMTLAGTFLNFTPTTAALGGTFRVLSNGGSITVVGECQQAWQALAASGSGKPLTVMDTNT